METCEYSACTKVPVGLLVDWENKKLLPACKDHENREISLLVFQAENSSYFEGYLEGIYVSTQI